MAEYNLSTELSDEVEKKFSTQLQNKDFINLIIESAAGNKKLFEELLFSSKYLMGIFRVIAGEEHVSEDVINTELFDNINKIVKLLKEILGERSRDFEELYFSSTKEALGNLTLLVAQLELFKLHINDLKREG